MIGTIWPAKPKILTIWSFAEKVCQPCSTHLNLYSLSFHCNIYWLFLFFPGLLISHLTNIFNLINVSTLPSNFIPVLLVFLFILGPCFVHTIFYFTLDSFASLITANSLLFKTLLENWSQRRISVTVPDSNIPLVFCSEFLGHL